MKIKILKNIKSKKSGFGGSRLWKAHRLEGVVKNKGIKNKK